ncbi:MAG: FG-GAP-like repeat-containing protein [Acidobacteria bacterium]|nr:FG-GAP-like repeat-containing protein [Acidobacteriota bacterium]
MSNKSGTSGQVISLPTGGGALSGIGETFAPDLHTGTGNFTVPIALPPGRNGFQPELNLVYSTGNGNSPFGLGWSLSIPGVSRKTSKGVPRYNDAEDTFILSGAEDLVAVETQGTKTRYQPRTEGLFAHIYHHRDASSNYWEVQSKDGLISRYGTEGMAGTDPAVIADPSKRDKVFAWKLSETRDPFGNRIEYEYERDMGQDGPHHWDQLYLKQIRYVEYEDDLGGEQFLVSMTFEYGERPDPFSEYRLGFELRTRKRCERIVIRTHAAEEHLARTYELTYLDERVAAGESPETVLPRNGVSLLSQISVIGHDESQPEEKDRTQVLPPLEFGYTRFEPEGRDFFPLAGSHLPAQSTASPDLELADLFGNGLPDVLEMNGTVRYWRNLGDGRFDLPRPMRDAPAGLTLADPGVQLLDADGNGRIDLMASQNGLSGYFPLQFNGEWDRRSFQRYDRAPSFSLEDPEVRLVDLDGDGVTDAIRSGTRLECFFHDPKAGWNATRFVERRALEEFPNFNFSDPRMKWADMSGDGLQDIVLVYDGNVEYWPNLGHGDWGRRVSMRHSPRFPYGYDPQRTLIGDVDGDGLADLVYVDHCKVVLWINQSGNRWSEPIEIDGTPDTTDMDAVRLADVLGSGISGILWSRDAAAPGRETMFFLDFTGGVKPYLLNEMNNHMGAVTRVDYAPSTRFYLEDQQRPETRWTTPLPFPVQVVACVEVIDEISRGKLTTEYSYHHGYWDGTEREFRGFGRVDQRDTEVFERYHTASLHPERTFEAVEQQMFSPPLETRTWFHQGPIDDGLGGWEEKDFSHEFWAGDPNLLTRPSATQQFLKNLLPRDRRDALRTLRGNILRTELYALDGSERQERPYTVTEFLYGVREEAPTDADEEGRPRIFFPHLLAQRTTQWERGDDPMTRFDFTEDYDAYGQPGKQTTIACPRGWHAPEDAPGEPYLATRSRTVYGQPVVPTVYIMDRVAKITTYEIENDGTQTIFELKNTPDDSPALTVIGQTLNFYDGGPFQGQPFAEIGDYGALVRSETLILTEEILREAYRSGDAILNPPEVPPYLVPGVAPTWTADYPQAFRDLLPPLAGYFFQPGGPNSQYVRGYFATTTRQRYDFHDAPAGRGLPAVNRDPLGRDTTVDYDDYDLLPTAVTDPAGLTTTAIYDYQVLQPREVIDPNRNHTRYAYTPLGLLKSTAVMGKPGENVGDTPQQPSTVFQYDLLAFDDSPSNNRQPTSVRTVRRAHHVNDVDVPLPERGETIETVEYSDGFGRLLQTRTQAEDIIFGDPIFGDAGLPSNQSVAPGDAVGQSPGQNVPANVVVSGWQVYNNKGQVVEKYEPFFATGWAYAPATGTQRGQKATMFYDPRGQVIRTLNPDGSEQRVIYGVPGAIAVPNLANPEVFEPTPWEIYTYDENDNAGRTHPNEGIGYQHHWNTPTSAVVDALGQTVVSVERNRTRLPDGSWSPIEEYKTESTYDIRGNLLTVRDPLGRVAFRYVYDLTPTGDEEEEKEGAQVVRIEQLDAGVRRTVSDAMGNEIERRDSKGALILRAFDELDRPIRLWTRDGENQEITLRERLIYGDSPETGLAPVQVEAANLRGEPYQHYDEAGRLTFEAYDFKGNVLEKARQVISDAAILAVFNPPPANWTVPAFRVDWQPPLEATLENYANGLLDATVYQTSLTYDALNRVKTLRYPQDVDGQRKVLLPGYNHAGALEQVALDGATYVQRIVYNAKGQRTLIAYGNGVMTRYAYDPQTFRLVRLRTEGYNHQPGTLTYQPTGALLQDFAYKYDLTGNILTIKDRTPESGIPNTALGPNALDRAFIYDPLYRLHSATGRECDTPPPAARWDDGPKCHDHTLTRPYAERYTYDRAGNLTRLRHTSGQGSFTRGFNLVAGTNRLQTVTIGADSHSYAYDVDGNLIRENTERHFEWDHSDRMRVYRTQPAGAEPSVHAHYLYDGSGQRVMKLVRRQGGQYEVRVYIDELFEHYRWGQNGPNAGQNQNNRLHIMDNQKRIALKRVGRQRPDDRGPEVQYHLGDHLGSSNLVVSENGTWINREEYTPYGETSFGGFARKRYRFTGKERDEESGLSYHGARYYAPWFACWLTADPIIWSTDSFRAKKTTFHESVYRYANNSPLEFVDATGLQPQTYDPGNMTPQLRGTIAHKEVLPTMARRINLLRVMSMLSGKFLFPYTATIEQATRAGGSSRKGSWSRGWIDLLIHATGGGLHVYDLKPLGTSRQYKGQLENYVHKTRTTLSATLGTVLERIRTQDPVNFAKIMSPIQSKRVPGRWYVPSLPTDPATGKAMPGFIEYATREIPPAKKPVPVVILEPALEKKPAPEKRFVPIEAPNTPKRLPFLEVILALILTWLLRGAPVSRVGTFGSPAGPVGPLQTL